MPNDVDGDIEGVDFALVAYREENVWHLEEIDEDLLHDLDSFATQLRRYPGDFGSLGLASVDEDFFVLVRVAGDRTRVLLSDVTAETEWPIARSVAPKSRAPASEVIVPPSNPATTDRPATGANSIRSALHSVGIGAFLRLSLRLCCRRTFAHSEPQCTYFR